MQANYTLGKLTRFDEDTQHNVVEINGMHYHDCSILTQKPLWQNDFVLLINTDDHEFIIVAPVKGL